MTTRTRGGQAYSNGDDPTGGSDASSDKTAAYAGKLNKVATTASRPVDLGCVDALEERDRGRACYRQRAWLDAYAALSRADQAAGLGAPDLELLAMAGFLVGRDHEAVRALERAHQAHLQESDLVGAARCAIWAGFGLLDFGEPAQAFGWFGRAGRLLDRAGRDCAERGYLLVPDVIQHLDEDTEAAYQTAAAIVEIGERCHDADLVTFALHAQGRARIRQGRVAEGAALLDEAMVAVVSGELASPLFTGLVYCSVIDACREVYDLDRAGEWTAALTRWCDAQPDLVNFTGQCRVHRAEIMQLRGEWRDSLAEARRAAERFSRKAREVAAATAHYQQAEVLRLLGEFAAAEQAYRAANAWGWQPQPGLALLRLAQGRVDVAVAAIQRVLDESTSRLDRARLLPAYVEILLAAGDAARARSASDELAKIADGYGTRVLIALAAQASGAVELAEAMPTRALVALRRACQLWQQVQAPYEVARVQVLMGMACRAVGDQDGAALELAAARAAFTQLGAAPELARLDALAAGAAGADPTGLTRRELEVLRLVAAGKSNRSIAAELVLSEKTVARHVSNILTKLGLPSRSAATAHAYEHGLV
jgi:DNA-binding CsgD family transcriptional regulator